LQGTAVSPGFANGTVTVYRPPALETVERRCIAPGETKAEIERFTAALDSAGAEVSAVRRQVAENVGESEAAIFDVHLAMLRDPAFLENICTRLTTEQVCAETALIDEMKAFTDRLAGSERAYIQELVMDVHDVGTRLLRHLSLDKSQTLPISLPPDSVIVARDLLPSETVGLDRKNVSGIATERGGPTSHAAILARSLGIPAVTGLVGLLDAAQDGDGCLLDGLRGTLVLNPSDARRQRFADRRREFEQAQELMHRMESKACRLKNGTPIRLLANINQSGDIDSINEHNLEGIGLYRTELLYLSARAAPGPQVQRQHYSRAAAACGEHPVTIRTFDFAADKHPSFLSVDPAAADTRGLRLALRHPQLFKTQLRAIVRTAREFPNLRILFPMVTGWWDLEEALKLLREVSQEEDLSHAIPAGAMIETPSAVFALPEILTRVDFISIGCNDLAQYTLALERNAPGQTLRESALHPSLLRAIGQIVATAAQSHCPVSVCGEAASDPLMAAIFTGLGLRAMSVSPARAPAVRYALRNLSLAEAEQAAECAIRSDPSGMPGKLLALLPTALRSILTMEQGDRSATPS
jgi:phosphoenolpyruvate-protein phosphotransferase